MRILTLWTLAITATLCVSITARADGETRAFQAQELTLQIPTEWKEQQASNNLRLAQFEIPAAEGDSESAELVIFPPFGGTVAENVKRWVNQFQPEGRTANMTQGEVDQGKYVLVDLSGTYNKPDGPPFRRQTIPTPGYRMVAVMLTTPKGGSYFLKLTGPEKTVAGAMDQFRKAFGADASKEEKYEF